MGTPAVPASAYLPLSTQASTENGEHLTSLEAEQDLGDRIRTTTSWWRSLMTTIRSGNYAFQRLVCGSSFIFGICLLLIGIAFILKASSSSGPLALHLILLAISGMSFLLLILATTCTQHCQLRQVTMSLIVPGLASFVVFAFFSSKLPTLAVHALLCSFYCFVLAFDAFYNIPTDLSAQDAPEGDV